MCATSRTARCAWALMFNIQGVQRGRRSRPYANAEAKMKNRWSQIISETLGAAAGTTLATLAFGDSATDVAVPCTDPVHMQLHKGIVLIPHPPCRRRRPRLQRHLASALRTAVRRLVCEQPHQQRNAVRCDGRYLVWSCRDYSINCWAGGQKFRHSVQRMLASNPD